MDSATILLVLALVVGLYVAWNIGANDVSNAMGTSVGSGAISLRQAILIAAIMEFCGAFFFGSHVSDTVQRGIVNPDIFADTPMLLVYGMISALIAAGVWLQLATYFGLPVSTTHTIVGAIVGFGAVVGGTDAVYWDKVGHIILSWVISPLSGGILGFTVFTILRRKVFYSSDPVGAARKLVPALAFVIVTIFVMVMTIKGSKNIKGDFSLWQASFVSLAAALTATSIITVLVRRIHAATLPRWRKSFIDDKTLAALDKARKHLRRAEVSSHGDLSFKVALALEEVESISHDAKHAADVSAGSSEFRAVEKMFVYLQIITACFMAFAHGANDVANAIGPLSASVAVLQTGIVSVKSTVPPWILAIGGGGIIIGLATWGWRVIETIGRKITALTPSRGFSADFSAATTVVVASSLGLPISTTHTLVGALLGVGLARGIGAINLSTIRDIVSTWLLTLPAGAAIAVGVFYALRAIFG